PTVRQNRFVPIVPSARLPLSTSLVRSICGPRFVSSSQQFKGECCRMLGGRDLPASLVTNGLVINQVGYSSNNYCSNQIGFSGGPQEPPSLHFDRKGIAVLTSKKSEYDRLSAFKDSRPCGDR